MRGSLKIGDFRSLKTEVNNFDAMSDNKGYKYESKSTYKKEINILK